MNKFIMGTTPNGERVHLIHHSQSMLARGTRNGSDYQSRCGEVPDHWDEQVAAPTDPTRICQRCAHGLAFADKSALPDDLDRETLLRAARLHDDLTGDTRVVDTNTDTDD